MNMHELLSRWMFARIRSKNGNVATVLDVRVGANGTVLLIISADGKCEVPSTEIEVQL